MKLSSSDVQKIALAKLKAQLTDEINVCLDADDLSSRPIGTQLDLLQDNEHNHLFVVSPNRTGKCLAKGTLVATPAGPCPIEDLKVGDTVYNEYGNPILVKATIYQGVKEVVDLTHRNVVHASCTPDHIWEVATSEGNRVCKKLKDFLKTDAIVRVNLDNPSASTTKLTIKVKNKRQEECYDIEVDSDTNLYCLANGLVTHNSQIGARAISWWLQGIHPFIPIREKWGTEFTILVIGRTTEIIETEIWGNKLRKFLPAGSYKIENKSGGGIGRVIHLQTGNKIVFMSHHDAKNAREKVQGFTAPIVWLDEMPDDISLMTELMMRTLTNDGIFIATFTPLVENEQIKKLVETPSKFSKIYKLKPEDNPKLLGPDGTLNDYELGLKAICAGEPEAVYRARRFGEWYYTSGRVVKAYDPARHFHELPPTYSPVHWRHVAVVDPAAVGLVGTTIWAEDQAARKWWCVYAKKIEGDAAYIIVKKLEDVFRNYNITERRCDCNPAGFYKEAIRQNIHYIPVADKHDRKFETIEKLNAFIASDTFMFCEASSELTDEFLSAKFSESNMNKIISSSNWHLIDTARYFADNLPAPLTTPVSFRSMNHKLKQEHKKEQARIEHKIQLIRSKQNRFRRGYGR